MAQIQVSIVTPEATIIDVAADGVVVTLIDGEKGILPGHAPMIGRLGPGEIRVSTKSGVERFYVDGGFVQIADNKVSILTGNGIPASKLNLDKAQADLDKARAQVATKPELMELRKKAIAQATAQVRMAEKSSNLK